MTTGPPYRRPDDATARTPPRHHRVGPTSQPPLVPVDKRMMRGEGMQQGRGLLPLSRNVTWCGPAAAA
ncbi:hypothetical protein [Streptomyces sp. NPDC018693]|uniref:hypothetical protein n=1 Tax=unclassified Streptomyces TaxID=2593676 RepID=UPI0037A8FFDC